MQHPVVDAEVPQVPVGVDKVVPARAALADALADQAGGGREIQAAVLLVRGVRDKGQGQLVTLGCRDAQPQRPIDTGDHLPVPEIVEHRLALSGGNAEDHAPAGAARSQPKYKARPLRRPAIAEGVDTEAAVIAPQQAHLCFPIGETWVPHERAIAEDPPVAGGRQRWAFAAHRVRHHALERIGIRNGAAGSHDAATPYRSGCIAANASAVPRSSRFQHAPTSRCRLDAIRSTSFMYSGLTPSIGGKSVPDPKSIRYRMTR